MTDELKQCPFCGSTRVSIMKLSDGKNKFAICMNCKASSNAAEKVEDVKYLWNKRVERTVKAELNPLAEDIVIGNTTFKVGTRVIAKCECGTWLRLGYKFCPDCGAKIDWSEE